MDASIRDKVLFYRGDWLFSLLCLITFLATITTGQNVFDNAWLIFGYEATFVISFLVRKGMRGMPERLFPVRSLGFWLLILWFCSVTFSLMYSPYGLMMEWFAVQRYFQSLFHIVFFLCLYGFFSTYERSIKPLFIALTASVMVLAFGFIAYWFMLEEPLTFDSKHWFKYYTPFNAHIRITGFLVAAASVSITSFFVEKVKSKFNLTLFSFIGFVVWGLMFWCGGRGSILSAVLVSATLAVLLKIKKQPVRRYLIVTGIFILGGIVLAELFKVFYWNGVFQATERTIAAGGDPYKLTSGRTQICGWVIKSLNNEQAWLFGLGSQGYCFMPNRTFGFQPHNLIFQFLAEWGIVGTILFLALIGYAFFEGAKAHLLTNAGKLSVPVLAALSIILSLGLHSLVDGIFYHAQPSMHLAIAFAVWMAYRR